MVIVLGNTYVPLTNAFMAVAAELIAFVTFATERSGLVVADGILVTDIRNGSAFVDVW